MLKDIKKKMDFSKTEHVISGSSIVAACKGQVSCDLNGEEAILNIKNGVYYGLDPVGARIWHLIQEPCPVNYIRDVLFKEYEVEAGRCECDLITLLQELLSAGLIEIKDETAS